MPLIVFYRGKHKWHQRSVLVLLTLWSWNVTGVRIPQCGSGVREMDMESSTNNDNDLTCEGAGSADRIDWSYTYSGSGGGRGSVICSSSGSCTTNALFTATRSPQSSSSRLTLRADVKQAREVYGTTTVTCITRPESDLSQETGSKSCDLDVVYRAEVTSCSAEFHTEEGTEWTASGRCDVSKAFSQRGRYDCQWTETTSGAIQSSRNLTGSSEEGGITYRSLTCHFTKPFPRVSGDYTYTVLISPGAVQPAVTFTGSPSVAVPTAHTTCPTDYVKEGDDINCTCSSTNGNPAGSAVWRGTGSSRLLLRNVTRGNHGNSYVCQVTWGSDVVSNTFRLQVAYGPDAVTINGPPQPYDTDGTKVMTFNCTAGNSRPGVTYRWRRLSGGSVVNDTQLTLTPVGSVDDGDQVECTAINTKFSAQLRASKQVKLDLHYPPTDAPTIRNSSSSSFVYQGQSLTLTCSVTSGKPVNATTLTFDCPSKQDNLDTHREREVISTVTFDPVVARDNGQNCTCRGRWKTYDWYTLHTQTTLVVYYAPSKPNITTGSQPYPFLEGESPTLYCGYPANADPGNPTATLTLNGQAGGTGQGQVSVTLGKLSSTDNGARMVCEASNQFTVHNNTRVTQERLLQVYYKPQITLTGSDGNMCVMTFDSTTCTILEGQRVHFRSQADSNPDPELYLWQAPDRSDLDPSNDRDLDIPTVNRTHSGVYRVQVNTSTSSDPDPRLPLTSHLDLTVLVNYTASNIVFNAANKLVTINESGRVTFDCQARGRPSPRLQLSLRNNAVDTRQGGKLGLKEDVTVLNHTISAAQCHHTGLYTCNANNGLGGPLQDTVQLNVNCKPRNGSDTSEKPPEVSYLGKPVVVSFRFIAFPVPDVFRFVHQVNGSDRNVTGTIGMNATCFTTDTDFDVTCNVSVYSVTSKAAEGLYKLTAANTFGQQDFLFRVKVNESLPEQSQQQTELNIGAIAGGIGAALLVIAIVAGVLFVMRRRRTEEKPHQSKRSRMAEHAREEPEMTVNELYGTSPGRPTKHDDDEVMIVNTAYVTSADVGAFTNKGSGNAYEDVELNSRPNATGEVDSAAGLNRVETKKPNAFTVEDTSNQYASVNKGAKQSLPTSDKPKKQRPDVQPKPAKNAKPEQPKDKPFGKKTAQQDEKRLLRAGEYSNMTPLSMSPPAQEGSVYENYGFEKEEDRSRKGPDEKSSRTVNEDGLVYTTVAFSEKQLKKAKEPAPEREETEYAGIDFTRKAPAAE